MTIVIPVIGYFILFNSEIMSRFEFSNQVVELSRGYYGLSDETLFKLFCIYFGFSFLAFGSILFIWLCPRPIKSNNTSASFIDERINNITDRAIRRMISELKLDDLRSEQIEANLSTLAALQRELHDPIGGKEYLVQQIDSMKEFRRQHSADLLNDYYVINSHRMFLLRTIIAVLFLIGFVLLAIPAGLMFWQVATRLLELVSRHL